MPEGLVPLIVAPGEAQMLLDQALLDEAAGRGSPMARAGLWRPPAVSLGRRMEPRGPYDPRRLRERGLDLVKRPTGGLAILHDESSFTLHIALPRGHPLARVPVDEAAARIAGMIAGALRGLGLEAHAPGPRPRRRLVPYPTGICLAYTASGDIVAGDGRKAGALALRGTPRGLLAQAVILVDSPDYEAWAWIDEYPVPGHLERAFTGLAPGRDPEELAGGVAELLAENLAGKDSGGRG